MCRCHHLCLCLFTCPRDRCWCNVPRYFEPPESTRRPARSAPRHRELSTSNCQHGTARRQLAQPVLSRRPECSSRVSAFIQTPERVVSLDREREPWVTAPWCMPAATVVAVAGVVAVAADDVQAAQAASPDVRPQAALAVDIARHVWAGSEAGRMWRQAGRLGRPAAAPAPTPPTAAAAGSSPPVATARRRLDTAARASRDSPCVRRVSTDRRSCPASDGGTPR